MDEYWRETGRNMEDSRRREYSQKVTTENIQNSK